MDKAVIDKRIEAIRSNERVGRGTCTTIDECYSDQELIEALDNAEVTTPLDAVQWCLDHEGIHIEAALNCRWGSDDDSELDRLNNWLNTISPQG